MEKPLVLSHSISIRTRYADTDKMGFVYNGNYLTFFEIGRTEVMRYHGLPYTEFEKRGYYLPLSEAHVNYKNPAYYDDILEIKATLVCEVKPTVRFDYEITRNGIEIANGYTIHPFFKSEIARPVKPPQFYLKAIQELKEKKELLEKNIT